MLWIFFVRYAKVREEVGNLSSRLENNISGMFVIKSFNAEKFESARVEEVTLFFFAVKECFAFHSVFKEMRQFWIWKK